MSERLNLKLHQADIGPMSENYRGRRYLDDGNDIGPTSYRHQADFGEVRRWPDDVGNDTRPTCYRISPMSDRHIIHMGPDVISKIGPTSYPPRADVV